MAKRKVKKKKDSNLITMIEYAKQKGVSYTTIKNHVKNGNITKVDGLIDPDLADQQLATNIDVTYSSKSKLTGTKEESSILFNKAKARREQAKAILAELELKEKSGELVSVKAVQKEAEDMYRQFRDAMINVANRATKKLLGETDEFKFRNALKKEIENAIKQVNK